MTLSPEMLNYLGYVAVATFTLSFIAKQEIWLLRAQMFGACLWITYGALKQDMPVVTANVLVAGASLLRQVKMALAARRAAAPPRP